MFFLTFLGFRGHELRIFSLINRNKQNPVITIINKKKCILKYFFFVLPIFTLLHLNHVLSSQVTKQENRKVV